jgi:iron complex outermembrane receptor protein
MPSVFAHLQIRSRTLSKQTALCLLQVVMGIAASKAHTQPPLSDSILIQDSPVPFRQFENIEITGSALKREVESTALPVLVLGRHEITRLGAIDLVTLVQRLPLMSNLLESGQFLAANGGYSNASVHGMPNATLVLVNGQRVAPYGRQGIGGAERTGVDLALIALSSVDRIEVLSDGASSLYGTDALAGVVNIITREVRRGSSLQVDVSQAAGHAGLYRVAALTTAKGRLDRDGYALRLEVEAARHEGLMGAQRPSLSAGETTLTIHGQNYNAIYFANLRPSAPKASLVGAERTFWNPVWGERVRQGLPCPAGWNALYTANACLFNNYPALSFYPAQNRAAAHGRLDAVLGANLKGYLDVHIGQVAQSAVSFWPERVASVSRGMGLDPWLDAAGLDSAQAYWAPPLPGPIKHAVHSTRTLSTGVTGLKGDWEIDLQAYHSESQARWRNARHIAPALYAGLQPVAGWFDANDAFQASLEALVSSDPIESGTTSLTGIHGQGRRDLFELRGGAAQLAMGLELRHERTRYTNIAFETRQPSFDLSRHVVGAFGELRTPWQSWLESTASIRADRYDSFHTVNAKLSTQLKPAGGWTLRASVGTGFRAPLVSQLHPARYLTDPYQVDPDFCDRLAAANVLGSCDKGAATVPTTLSGNSALRPETSRQMTLGVRRDFSPRLSVSLDGWQVSIRDQIGTPPALQITRNPAAYLDNFTRDDTGQVVLYVPLINLARTFKRGLDLDLRWRHPTAAGRLGLQALVTGHLASWRDDGQTRQSDLGRVSTMTFQVEPRLNAQVLLSLQQGRASVGAIWRYRSAYQDLPVYLINTATRSPELVTPRVEAFSTVDLIAQWQAHNRWEIKAGIYNAEDRLPALRIHSPSPLTPGVNTAYTPLWGRTVRISATHRW